MIDLKNRVITLRVDDKTDKVLALVDRLIVTYHARFGDVLSFSEEEAFELIQDWLYDHVHDLLESEKHHPEMLQDYVNRQIDAGYRNPVNMRD